MLTQLDDETFSSDYYETGAKQISYKDSPLSECEDCVIFQQLDMFSEGFRIMEEIRKQGTLCDVQLTVLILLFKLRVSKEFRISKSMNNIVTISG